MRDHPSSKKAFFPGKGPIDKLIDYDKSAGRQFVAKRAHSRKRYKIGYPGPFQGIYIGAVIDRARAVAMTPAMARQEDQLYTVQLAKEQFIGRLAPRPADFLPAYVSQPVDFIQAAAADHAKGQALGDTRSC